jgi:cell wall-associated NlpC family hydrolase
MRPLFAFAALLVLPLTGTLQAQTLTRAEAIAIAETFVNHTWKATPAQVRHGKDSNGIEIHTPDRAGGQAQPSAEAWVVNETNTGVPYKWGGFDNPKKFDAGVKAGKGAGDLYTSEKRRLGGKAVSGDVVGVDCSGFVSRCWKLTEKHSTSTLAGISRKLPSASELKPGDVMNTSGGHVLLFVKWLNPEQTRGLFYEAAPFSKTRASEYEVADLTGSGYQPLRYKGIKD